MVFRAAIGTEHELSSAESTLKGNKQAPQASTLVPSLAPCLYLQPLTLCEERSCSVTSSLLPPILTAPGRARRGESWSQGGPIQPHGSCSSCSPSPYRGKAAGCYSVKPGEWRNLCFATFCINIQTLSYLFLCKYNFRSYLCHHHF